MQVGGTTDEYLLPNGFVTPQCMDYECPMTKHQPCGTGDLCLSILDGIDTGRGGWALIQERRPASEMRWPTISLLFRAEKDILLQKIMQGNNIRREPHRLQCLPLQACHFQLISSYTYLTLEPETSRSSDHQIKPSGNRSATLLQRVGQTAARLLQLELADQPTDLTGSPEADLCRFSAEFNHQRRNLNVTDFPAPVALDALFLDLTLLVILLT